MIKKEILIDYDDGKLGGIQFGDENKPKLLCLHGWLDNSASFTPLAEELVDSFCLLAIDLPGHGNSYHLEPRAHYHLMDSVFFIEKLRLSLKMEKINFLCHSLGGVLCGLYAGIFPERVNKIFSIEALGPITESSSTSSQRAREYIEKRIKIEEKGQRYHKSMESCLKSRTRDGRLKIKEAKILLERGVLRTDKGYKWKFDQRLILPSILRMTEDQCQEILANISAPYHLIKGNEAFSLLEKAIPLRSKLIKSFYLHELKGGHHLHMEEPKDTAKIIKENY